ncbi:hypothetical protein Tco_0273926 [Tanacetum coccineum]
MGDENPICTLGDYSRPSQEGYQNTIELPGGNNVVPLRSDTIRLVQNRCSFHRLQSKDPNQHLKDFLKLVDSLDFDVANRERTRLDSMARVNAVSINHLKKNAPRSKGIKSSSKVLSPKYQSQSSLEEQNRNLSSPKTSKGDDHSTTVRTEEEVKEESEESDEETEGETNEKEEDDP